MTGPCKVETPTSLLTTRTVTVCSLGAAEISAMYDLFSQFFAGGTRTTFVDDLAEKQWAFLLEDEHGQLEGFSTLLRLEGTVDGIRRVAFFSGDTIVRPNYWGRHTLPQAWLKHVMPMVDSLNGATAYWFLISSGYRTYLLLRAFVRRFYPSFRWETPGDEQRVLDYFANSKFGNRYNATTGVIQLQHATSLVAGTADVTAEVLKYPHVRYFVQRNPRYDKGDELACICRLSRENLTEVARLSLES